MKILILIYLENFRKKNPKLVSVDGQLCELVTSLVSCTCWLEFLQKLLKLPSELGGKSPGNPR